MLPTLISLQLYHLSFSFNSSISVRSCNLIFYLSRRRREDNKIARELSVYSRLQRFVIWAASQIPFFHKSGARGSSWSRNDVAFRMNESIELDRSDNKMIRFTENAQTKSSISARAIRTNNPPSQTFRPRRR